MLGEEVTVRTIVREIQADLETPVSVYLKLRGQSESFLLESIDGGERIARYSFIGLAPRIKYILRSDLIQVIENGTERIIPFTDDPLKVLEAELKRFRFNPQPGLPRFCGGLVGYLGYEAVTHFEPTLKSHVPAATLPEGIYQLADTIVAFDHARRSLFLIANVLDGDDAAAQTKLDDLVARIRQPLPTIITRPASLKEIVSNKTQGEFEEMVQTAKEYIAAGDIFQVVPSQRFTRPTHAEAFDIYRAVRRINPSPYMFFFDFGVIDGEPLFLVGASPEMFVRLEGRHASLRPIAGTRPRGANAEEDASLAEELLADPKERAEHVMLVDLGRNDLGRVCDYGSVNVPEFFNVERFSHVMHIVSHVEGTLRADMTAFDLVRAAFPAGTVSGAPKVRAMEIIAQLEGQPRNIYSGMVGYFGFDGAMDTCIAIRTLVAHGNNVTIQAGAGIVSDSDPTNEYYETVNKATAMLRAIEAAETPG
jgi:anthranilate synthase component 1